jgi:hypothetical protein
VLLLGATVASADTIAFLPAAQYNLSAEVGTCKGFDCSITYDKQLIAHGPAALQVGCTAAVGAPNCAGSILSATPSPILSVGATTSLGNTEQNSGADANVTYDYEVLCPKCPPGTLVPLSIGGDMGARYSQGTGGTVGIQVLDRIFVNGYNPVTSKDNVLIYLAMEGSQVFSTDLTKTPNPLTGTAPGDFGFCESTWTGFHTCTGGPGSPYGTPFEVRVNEVYSIFLDANVSIGAINQPFSTSSAEGDLDPVITFGPGFDSTGYSIVLSPGIGNEASSVPEPAAWMFLSTATLALVSGHRLRRHDKGRFKGGFICTRVRRFARVAAKCRRLAVSRCGMGLFVA